MANKDEGPLAPAQSPRPVSREEAASKKQLDREMQENFGDMEFEQDIESQGYSDPLVRIGFGANDGDGTGARVIPQNLNAAGLYTPRGDFQVDGFLQRAGRDGGKPGNVYTTGDFAGSNTVWSHEMRHRGIGRLRDYLQGDVDGFVKQYLPRTNVYERTIARELIEGDKAYEEAMVDLMDHDSPEEMGFDLTKLSDDTKGMSGSTLEHYTRVKDALHQAAEDMSVASGSPERFERETEGEKQGFWSRLFGSSEYNKGGVVSKMDKMYEKGGLATDGLSVDPVSGNDIPTGSNAADVRDDVDAKLSEGEYVVPADVVKYIGVSTLEKLVNKAKDGLQEMEDNGRIGGASPKAKEEIMEYSLGADVDSIDAYATGGLVDGKDYADAIDRIKTAALKDPTITNMLKSKGIFIEGGNEGTPIQMAEGGLVDDYSPSNFTSNYNPYAHTPNFSAQGTVPVGVGGSTAAPKAPVTCPPGFVFDVNTNSCVKDPNAQTQSSGGGGGGGGGYRPPPKDPNSWMDKYDYNSPEGLVSDTMSNLGVGEEDTKGEGGFLGGLSDLASDVFGGTVVGGAFNRLTASSSYAEAMANAAVLESHGHTAEASSIREAAGAYAEANKVRVGGFFDSTDRYTTDATRLHGANTMGQTTTTAPQTPTGGGGSSFQGRATPSGNKSERTESKNKAKSDTRGDQPTPNYAIGSGKDRVAGSGKTGLAAPKTSTKTSTKTSANYGPPSTSSKSSSSSGLGSKPNYGPPSTSSKTYSGGSGR